MFIGPYLVCINSTFPEKDWGFQTLNRTTRFRLSSTRVLRNNILGVFDSSSKLSLL